MLLHRRSGSAILTQYSWTDPGSQPGRVLVGDHRRMSGAASGPPPGPLPMLAVAGDLPVGPDWSAEVKWDGVRLVVEVGSGGAVRCWTRSGRPVGATWPEVTAAVPAGLVGRTAVLDGEVIALGPDGTPSFAALQRRLGVSGVADVRRAATAVPAALMAFDLLALDGRDTTGEPWERRRALLEGLDVAPWQVPPASDDPAALAEFTRRAGLEGVVCKRRASVYRPGVRSPDWVKVKHVHTRDVVVGGWLPGAGGRTGDLGALLAGVPAGAGLRYLGRVGTGFTAAARRELLAVMAPLAATRSPFLAPSGQSVSPVPPAVARAAVWVDPVLVGEVAFAEWTVNRLLRHPVWRGLRPELSVADVVEEP